MPPLSDGVFLTENRHKSFSNKLFINTAKYLGFRIFRFKPVTKVVEGMSKQTGHHPGQGCSSQGECVAVNRLRTIPAIHQSEYLRHPPPNIPKQSSSAVFSRLGIPLKIHTSVLSFFLHDHSKKYAFEVFLHKCRWLKINRGGRERLQKREWLLLLNCLYLDYNQFLLPLVTRSKRGVISCGRFTDFCVHPL